MIKAFSQDSLNNQWTKVFTVYKDPFNNYSNYNNCFMEFEIFYSTVNDTPTEPTIKGSTFQVSTRDVAGVISINLVDISPTGYFDACYKVETDSNNKQVYAVYVRLKPAYTFNVAKIYLNMTKCAFTELIKFYSFQKPQDTLTGITMATSVGDYNIPIILQNTEESIEKLKSINLVDPSRLKVDYEIRYASAGLDYEYIAVEGKTSLDYLIPCKSGEVYAVNKAWTRLVFFDASKRVVSSVQPSTSNSNFTIADNVAYFSAYSTNFTDMMIVKGNTIPSVYTSYGTITELAMSGNIVLVATPAVTGSSATAVNAAIAGTDAKFTRTVTLNLKTTGGTIHNWFSGSMNIAVAKSSSAGVVAISGGATKATFVKGVANVTLEYTGTWVLGDTTTLTVTGGTVLGYTVTNKTSVDTLIA